VELSHDSDAGGTRKHSSCRFSQMYEMQVSCRVLGELYILETLSYTQFVRSKSSFLDSQVQSLPQ